MIRTGAAHCASFALNTAITRFQSCVPAHNPASTFALTLLGIFELVCLRKFSSHAKPLRSAKPRTRSRVRLTGMDGYWCNKYGGTTVRGITQGKVRYALRSFKGQLRRSFRFRVQKRNCANAPSGMEPRFKRCPKLSSHSSRNCLLCLRCSSPLWGPSLNFGLEILSAVTSCIRAIVRTWIYADRILSNEADSTIYSREFHGAELGRILSHNRGDSLHVTHLEKWPNQGDVANGCVVHTMDVHEVRSRTDKRGVNVSDALPFGRLWYAEPDAISNAIGYAKFFSRSHDAVIRVYDAGLPNARSARAMQNGVRFALLHFRQQLTDFRCGRRNDLDTAPFRLR
jgi:hypothetical protein